MKIKTTMRQHYIISGRLKLKLTPYVGKHVGQILYSYMAGKSIY